MSVLRKEMVFIPGAQKSGTTTLYDILKNHSNITECTVKEPQFFALKEETIKKYISWYFNLFKNDKKNKMLIDASTFYLSSERACLNIKKYVKNPRFVVIIRDPVKRAFSAHLHMKKKIPKYDKRTFDNIVKILRKRLEENAENLPEVENEFLEESFKDGSVQPYIDRHYLKEQYDAPFDSSFEDPRWLFKYFTESQYHRNIERLISVFGDNRVKVILFERLVDDSQEVLNTILDFLDLQQEKLELPHSNVTKIPSKTGRFMMGIINSNSFINKFWTDLQSSEKFTLITDKINETFWKEKPTLSFETYQEARSLLQHEYSYWRLKDNEIDKYWRYKSI